ncbi:PepSY domain-containing protein [Devosia sp. CAU 1758]
MGQSNSGNAPGNSGNAPGNSGNAPGNSGTGNSGSAPGNSSNAPGNSDSASGPGARPQPPAGTGAPIADHSRPSGTAPGSNSAPGDAPSVSPPDTVTTLSPDQVRDAVDARQAMPLARLGDVIRSRGGGEIVDADLVRVDRMLVYAIKVIDPLGRLSVQYFHARSGVYIGSE